MKDEGKNMKDGAESSKSAVMVSLPNPSPISSGHLDYTKLAVVPISLDEANAFVSAHHRHHNPCTGHKFSIAISDGKAIRGVAIIGRPVARLASDGFTLEVNRCCTDGVKNGCSMLYASAWRAAKGMGYRKLITYTLPEEGGISLRASGWKLIGETRGGKWARAERPRVDSHPTQGKLKWEAA